MKLINLDDLVLMGPGSEWLWTAVSGIVLAVTFLAIYRQLRVQRATNAWAQMKELEERWTSPRMMAIQLRVVRGLKSGDDPDIEALALQDITSFFEGVNVLHEQGFLETEVVMFGIGPDVVRWWTMVEPLIRRVQAVYPGEGRGFERLAGVIRTEMAKRGFPEFKTDPESVAVRIDFVIEHLEQRARLERELAPDEIQPVGQGKSRRAKTAQAPAPV